MRPRILGAIVAVALLAIAALAVPLALRLADDARAQATARLDRVAIASASRLPNQIRPDSTLPLPDLSSDGDLSVYDALGVRLGGEGPNRADAFVNRALAGHTNNGGTNSAIVVAVPVVRDQRVVAAVRVSEPIGVTNDEIRRQRVTIALLGLAAIVFAAIVGLGVSSALARPLRRLRASAASLGDGDFTVRTPRSGIGEVDDVAQALDDTAARLGELVERERRFSVSASHQLRTPLTSLRLAVESELARPRPDPRTVLAEVLVEADRLEQTIGDLLALARGAAQRGPIDLEAITRAAEQRWHGSFAALGRPVRVRVHHDPTTQAHASASAVDQILDVLLGNALCHGAGAVTITVRAGAQGGAILAVEDEGAGIPGDSTSVFDAAAKDGHGFGLPLAASLAHADGALLRLANAGPNPRFELILR
jgi:signal transduction histidine kinase